MHKSLNELSDPKNNKVFYYTNLKKFIDIVLHNISFKMDWLGKRNYTNYVGGNSDYGPKFLYSYNFKDMCKQLLSCKNYKLNLSKGIDIGSYSKCLN